MTNSDIDKLQQEPLKIFNLSAKPFHGKMENIKTRRTTAMELELEEMLEEEAENEREEMAWELIRSLEITSYEDILNILGLDTYDLQVELDKINRGI